MRVQFVIIGVAFLGAMIAVPFFHDHRMNAGVWLAGMILFIGLPLLAGALQSQPSRAALMAAGILLMVCPLVYVVTDPLAVQYEKLRDGFFLATGATILFVCVAWSSRFVRSRKWFAFSVAASGAVSAAAAIYVMVSMFIYFE